VLENFFGLIEATFVAACAIGFYIWQMRSLNRDIAKRKAREKDDSE
jgi:hypothetical protein